MGPIPTNLRILPLAVALTLGVAASSLRGQTVRHADARASIELTVEGVFPEAIERLATGSTWAERLRVRPSARARALAERLNAHNRRRNRALHRPGRTFAEIQRRLDDLDREWATLAREARSLLSTDPAQPSSGRSTGPSDSSTR